MMEVFVHVLTVIQYLSIAALIVTLIIVGLTFWQTVINEIKDTMSDFRSERRRLSLYNPSEFERWNQDAKRHKMNRAEEKARRAELNKIKDADQFAAAWLDMYKHGRHAALPR